MGPPTTGKSSTRSIFELSKKPNIILCIMLMSLDPKRLGQNVRKNRKKEKKNVHLKSSARHHYSAENGKRGEFEMLASSSVFFRLQSPPPVR